ncbi:MAG: thiamine pyrophosphate-binding protein [Verrucomicrobiales bacterium]
MTVRRSAGRSKPGQKHVRPRDDRQHLPPRPRHIIERQFGKKSEDVLPRQCNDGLRHDYAYQVADIFGKEFQVQHGKSQDTHRIATDGNTIMAYGLIAAGVRYGSGYPITPWSPIMEILRSELPKYGGMFIQAEDELAAVSMALGFAYAGHLSITGSSGPGLSLKMEALSYATMAEIPLIVINVQRGGPSTGLPTSVEQSDLMQAIYGSHGDCPRVVLAPKNVEDCFYIALEAGRIAKKYSVPVIILSDQAISSRIEAFREPVLDECLTEPELDLTPRTESTPPYQLGSITQHVPPGAKMPEKYPVVTGLEHDEWGHPSANPVQHQKMNARRREKLKMLADELQPPTVYGDESGEVLLIGWGSTYGPIREAVDRSRAAGRQMGQVHLRHIHPMPPGIDEIAERYQHVFVVEMNDEGLYGCGQLATLLRARYGSAKFQSICKTDGLTFRIREILAGVESGIQNA